jgi:hypothetical protein
MRHTVLILAAAGAISSCAHLDSGAALPDEAEAVRRTELLRLQLLVAGDVERARTLHTTDFQLVNPVGRSFTREEYLGSLSSGYLDYLQWDAGPIDVRVAGRFAVLRYRSQIQVSLGGERRPLLPHWHTDYYEKRDGRWQVVWSQATEVK